MALAENYQEFVSTLMKGFEDNPAVQIRIGSLQTMDTPIDVVDILVLWNNPEPDKWFSLFPVSLDSLERTRSSTDLAKYVVACLKEAYARRASHHD